MPASEISILARRRIEAEFARALMPELERALGRDEAFSLIGRVAATLARESGANFAADSEAQPPGLPQMAKLLPMWERDGALALQFLERGEERLSFNVVRCRYAEMYRELGMAELGSHLSCQRDAEFCKGLNPAIRFERSQTIMQGASHCDFRYHLEPRHDSDA